MNDKFVFFYGGVFSQWYQRRFKVDGTEYDCAEQYMMAMKAKTFGDDEIHKDIMDATTPAEQKALGRRVKGFNADVWNSVCKDIAYKANLAKFSDPKMTPYLLSTGDKEIVEANPFDKIWGIGLGMNYLDRFDKSKWRGTNWLGEVLMRVRETLRK